MEVIEQELIEKHGIEKAAEIIYHNKKVEDLLIKMHTNNAEYDEKISYDFSYPTLVKEIGMIGIYEKSMKLHQEIKKEEDSESDCESDS